MDNAAEVLLIVVSTVLSIFLVVCIIAGVWIIRVLKHVNHITEKAEKIADQAENVGAFFQKSAGSAAIGSLIANIINSVRQGKSHKGNGDER